MAHLNQQHSSAAVPLLPLHQQQVSLSSRSESCLLPPRSNSRRRSLSQTGGSQSHPASPSDAPSRTCRRAPPRVPHRQFSPQPQQPHNQPPVNLARVHSGSAVAGFVVGTIFEACLVGLLGLLTLHGNIPESDPLLCYAILSLLVVLAWSVLFQVVLFHLDNLCPPASAASSSFLMNSSDQQNVYGHFNMGLAWGMGLECILLHYIFQSRTTEALAQLLSPFSTAGIVSGLFGMGCVVMTVIRTYYHKGGKSSSSNRGQLQRSQSQASIAYQRMNDLQGVASMV